MRSLGFSSALLLAAAVAAFAQPPGLPPRANAPAPADPVLDAHLLAWQKTMSEAKNFSAEFEISKIDPNFPKTPQKFTGSVWCMKPYLARMSQSSVSNRQDYEAFICDGKSLFHYDWKAKLITEIPINAEMGDNLMLDFLRGMSAETVKKRFFIKQRETNPPDKNYLYLEIKPKLPRDAQEFDSITMALFKPGVPKGYIPYLPVQVDIKKPNGEKEIWKFSKQMVNVPNMDPHAFQYTKPQGTNWQYRKQPVQQSRPMPPMPGAPPILPGGNGLRPGEGAVKQR
jgi:TIGR03009 family protein